MEAFPAGPAVKNLPATAGDTGSVPGPGSFHGPRSHWACVPLLLRPHSRACAPQQEKHRSETPVCGQEDPAWPKIAKKKS